MNERKINQLPPIIVDYINKVGNPTTPRHQRDMYCMILERVRDACDEQIRNFRRANLKK